MEPVRVAARSGREWTMDAGNVVRWITTATSAQMRPKQSWSRGSSKRVSDANKAKVDGWRAAGQHEESQGCPSRGGDGPSFPGHFAGRKRISMKNGPRIPPAGLISSNKLVGKLVGDGVLQLTYYEDLPWDVQADSGAPRS